MSGMRVLRTLRQPLIWLVIVAFAVLALLAVESSGPGQPPKATPLSKVAQGQDAKPSKDGGGDKGGQDKHCQDGKGQDNNKHCRGISGS
jgi:hypothetical protein